MINNRPETSQETDQQQTSTASTPITLPTLGFEEANQETSSNGTTEISEHFRSDMTNVPENISRAFRGISVRQSII